MPEYYVIGNSNDAPMCSDESKKFVNGTTPQEAMNNFIKHYDHPFGLYSAYLYKDANAYAKNERHLCEWLSEKALKNQR